MPDLTAERLHEITEPVWLKHPGARAERLEYADSGWWMGIGAGNGQVCILLHHATLLCEAQMARWLAEESCFPQMDRTRDGWAVRLLGQLMEQVEYAPTLTEALAAACMAVSDE